MPVRTNYKDVLKLDDPALEEAVLQGRELLKTNDVIMTSSVGGEYSVYESPLVAVLEVVMVNTAMGIRDRDWAKIALALAALEVALGRADQLADENGPTVKQQQLDRLCASLVRHVRVRIRELPEPQQQEALRALDVLTRHDIP